MVTLWTLLSYLIPFHFMWSYLIPFHFVLWPMQVVYNSGSCTNHSFLMTVPDTHLWSDTLIEIMGFGHSFAQWFFSACWNTTLILFIKVILDLCLQHAVWGIWRYYQTKCVLEYNKCWFLVFHGEITQIPQLKGKKLKYSRTSRKPLKCQEHD